MKAIRILSLAAVVLVFHTFLPAALRDGQATAQVKSKTAEESMKDQAKAKKQREKESEKAYQSKQDHHRKIQTRKTRRRMKQNTRKAERARTGKSDPFWKRWFRKRHFK